MANFLNEFFNKGTFIGEIITSFLIILLLLIINLHFAHKNLIKVLLMSSIFFAAILIGQGIANSIASSSPVFGILSSAILSAFFYNKFNLLWIIILAQILGSLLGFLFYLPYRHLFKKDIVDAKNHKKLNLLQLTYKESLAQMIYSCIIMFIPHVAYNSYGTSTILTPFVFSLMTLFSLIVLMLIFLPVNMFMISPIISIFTSHLWFQGTFNIKALIINNHAYLLQTILQTLIWLTFILTVGFTFKEIKWWN